MRLLVVYTRVHKLQEATQRKVIIHPLSFSSNIELEQRDGHIALTKTCDSSPKDFDSCSIKKKEVFCN